MDKVKIIKVENSDQLDKVHRIRELVFIIEQNVPKDREYDDFENVSTHYLALVDGLPVGCIRYRILDEKIKIERLAVINEMRSNGIGHLLMDKVEDETKIHGKGEYVLNSQLVAMEFYRNCGYQSRGPVFLDAGIEHKEMYKEVK